MLWAVPLGIIGARIYHVLTHPDDYFYAGPGPACRHSLYIWEGGIAIFGALIGGAVGVFIGCRITGLRFWAFADALAPGLLLAQAFGRLGNWFNHELFGCPPTCPWGLEIESTNPAFPAGLPTARCSTRRSSTRSCGTVGSGVAVALARSLERHVLPTLQWGKMLGSLPDLVRPRPRLLRVDPRRPERDVPRHPRRTSGPRSLAILLGIVIIIVQRRRHPGLEPSPYLPGSRMEAPDAEVDSDEHRFRHG